MCNAADSSIAGAGDLPAAAAAAGAEAGSLADGGQGEAAGELSLEDDEVVMEEWGRAMEEGVCASVVA
jgi:hypothetical protein